MALLAARAAPILQPRHGVGWSRNSAVLVALPVDKAANIAAICHTRSFVIPGRQCRVRTSASVLASAPSGAKKPRQLDEDWRKKSKPVPPGGVYPAKELCSKCGLCDTYVSLSHSASCRRKPHMLDQILHEYGHLFTSHECCSNAFGTVWQNDSMHMLSKPSHCVRTFHFQCLKHYIPSRAKSSLFGTAKQYDLSGCKQV